MLFTIIFCVLTMIGGTSAVNSNRNFVATYGVPRKVLSNTSWAGKQVIAAYNALPASNRPYADVMTIVKALDFKFGGAQTLDNHFTVTRYSGGSTRTTTSWKCECYSYERCPYHEYRKIHNALEETKKAIADQQYKLALAGHSHGMDEANALLEQLRRERELINDVTKELT